MTDEDGDRLTVTEAVRIYETFVDYADRRHGDDPETLFEFRWAMLLIINDRQAAEAIIGRMDPRERESVRRGLEGFRSGLIRVGSEDNGTGAAPEHGDRVLRTAETVLSVFDSCGSVRRV